MRISLLLAASAAAALCSAPASAAVYLFNLTGGKTATFSIDTAVPPASSSSSFIGDQVAYNNVTGLFGGITQTAAIGFGTNLAAQLNIGGTSLGFTQYGGPDFFTLVNGSPVFNLGSFNLSSITSGAATLTISSVSSAVPEPATWAMMMVGFAAIGAAMRRRAPLKLALARA